MKITRQQYDDAIRAAMEVTAAGNAAYPRYQSATSAILHSLGIEVESSDECACSDEFVWVERTWVDVRQGDVIRPAGQTDETHAARVVTIGPVNRWHAAPGASQYRPNESPMEWSARAVTLAPILVNAGRASSVTHTPQHGMRPDAAVDIKVTRGELAAIEALGGWHNRIEAAQ